MVYGHLLRPEGGVPMDFASCADCSHETTETNWWRSNDTSIDWYEVQWSSMRRHLPLLSLVSQQIYTEVGDVFWSQPFRFTGSVGRMMLCLFLDRIGVDNIARLKSSTVCHPGFASSPRRYARFELERRFYDLFLSHHKVTQPHITPFGLDTFTYLLLFDENTAMKMWEKDCLSHGPLELLLKHAKSLTQLTLTLAQFQTPEHQSRFEGVRTHAIHDVVWPQGEKLSRRIIYLISAWEEPPWPRHQLTFQQIYGENDYYDLQAAATKEFLAETFGLVVPYEESLGWA